MIRRYIYFLKFHFFFILQTYKLIHKFLIIQLRIVFLIRRKSEVPDKVKETFYNLSYNGKSCQKTKLHHYRRHPQKNKFFLKFFKVFFKFFFIFSENVKGFSYGFRKVIDSFNEPIDFIGWREINYPLSLHQRKTKRIK